MLYRQVLLKSVVKSLAVCSAMTGDPWSFAALPFTVDAHKPKVAPLFPYWLDAESQHRMDSYLLGGKKGTVLFIFRRQIQAIFWEGNSLS